MALPTDYSFEQSDFLSGIYIGILSPGALQMECGICLAFEGIFVPGTYLTLVW